MCQDLKLIIEVDGSSHDSLEMYINDQKREQQLINAGFVVLRFTNEEVLTSMDWVKKEISNKIREIELQQ